MAKPSKSAFHSAIGCMNSFTKESGRKACVVGVLIHDGVIRKMTAKEVNAFVQEARKKRSRHV